MANKKSDKKNGTRKHAGGKSTKRTTPVNKGSSSVNSTQNMHGYTKNQYYDNYQQFQRNGFSNSFAGKYSKYPGILAIITFLIGALAGLPPFANSYIDDNNLTGTSAGAIWFKVMLIMVGFAIGSYVLETRLE
jgi:hypothetical protein